VVPLRLEAVLALGEVLTRRADPAARMLPALARDAQARGFHRIAAEARRFLHESTSSWIAGAPSRAPAR
jgi:hypothetical protein